MVGLMAGQSRTFWVAVCVAIVTFGVSCAFLDKIDSRNWESEKMRGKLQDSQKRHAREMLMTKESVDPELQLRG